MSEEAPQFEGMKKSEYTRLAIELSERPEAFEFFGISDEAYRAMKKVEDESDSDYPDRTILIDIRMEKFRTHGAKVVLGKNPQSGMVYVLPFNSYSIEEDGIFPRQLEIHNGIDPKLKKLILANRRPFLKI